MALTFKTFQFFGGYWATIPLALSYVASIQRMQDGKHWVSDIIGSFFLSAFALKGCGLQMVTNKITPYINGCLSMILGWVSYDIKRVGLLV